MNILLTAIGKRVQLVNYLKKSCKIIGVDAGDTSPASKFVDKFYKVPKFNEKSYISSLLKICKNEDVDLLIPLHEYEFYILCDNRDKFRKIGTTLILSNRGVLDVCQDKIKTYEFFTKAGLGTPKSYCRKQIINFLSLVKSKNILDDKEMEIFLKNEFTLVFPLIIKPLDGMGSEGVFKINNVRELKFFIDYVKNPIIQEYIEGIEYTIDILCDFEGNPVSIVPRERIEVRSGEVSKSRTVRHKQIIKETHRLIEELIKQGNIAQKMNDRKYNVIGPYTVQCKIDSQNNIKFIEINPRFGGGVPLTFEAGVDYGRLFKMMVNEEKIVPDIGQFHEITMLRYDEAVFVV